MDAETQEKIHRVELHQGRQDARMDGFEQLLKFQTQAFNDFKAMVNGWARKFAYIALAGVFAMVKGEDGSSLLISAILKAVGV